MINKKLKMNALTVISGFLLAACGDSGSAESPISNADTSNSDDPVKISTLQPYWGAMPDEDGPLFEEVERIMNAELDPIFVQGPNMMDRLNVTLASGELPDILTVFQGNQPSIIQAVRAGAFWEVGAYLDDYPHLKASRDEIRDENIKIDGKIWALYDPEFIARSGINMRQDWLDNLGLEKPTTLDELYEVLRAFTYDDPDGNGIQDTIGVATTSALLLQDKFGVPNGYKVEDGKFIPKFETEEYREALKFSRRLYEEGIMNRDVAYVQQNQVDEMIQAGTVGAYIGNADRNDIFSVMLDNFPEAELVTFSDIGNPSYIHTSLGYWSTLMFPKSSIETEERLHEILTALNQFADPKHQEFRLNGLPDVDDSLMTAKMEALNVLALNSPEAELEGLEDWHAEMKEVVMENENSEYLVNNPSTPLLSDTQSEIGNELDTLITDAEVNYVTGEIDDHELDAIIEQWYETGGAEMIKEYEEQYNKNAE